MTKLSLVALIAIAFVCGEARAGGFSAGVPGEIESKPIKGMLPARNRTVLGLTVGRH